MVWVSAWYQLSICPVLAQIWLSIAMVNVLSDSEVKSAWYWRGIGLVSMWNQLSINVVTDRYHLGINVVLAWYWHCIGPVLMWYWPGIDVILDRYQCGIGSILPVSTRVSKCYGHTDVCPSKIWLTLCNIFRFVHANWKIHPILLNFFKIILRCIIGVFSAIILHKIVETDIWPRKNHNIKNVWYHYQPSIGLVSAQYWFGIIYPVAFFYKLSCMKCAEHTMEFSKTAMYPLYPASG